MNLVKVVIPIYQASLSQQERKSLLQVYKILQMHPLVVIKPNHLDLSELATEFPKLSFISFADFYFKGISGYNRLMLAKEFYERFCRHLSGCFCCKNEKKQIGRAHV